MPFFEANFEKILIVSRFESELSSTPSKKSLSTFHCVPCPYSRQPSSLQYCRQTFEHALQIVACKKLRGNSKKLKSNYAQRTSIADGGGIEKPPHGNRRSIEKLLMKIKTKSLIANVQTEQKLNSELQPIASTSSPTIGNTLVGGSFTFLNLMLLYFVT